MRAELIAQGVGLVSLTLVLLVTPNQGAAGAETADRSAWQELVDNQPESARDPGLPVQERRALMVLTSEQAGRWYAGEDARDIQLGNGETLEAFLDRQRRVDDSGLLYRPLVPCRVLDTRRIGSALRAGDELQLQLRGPATDYSEQGGSSAGCGIPGLRGETFQTNTARALMLSVEVDDPSGPGELELWPGGSARRPGIGLVSYSDQQPAIRQTIVVPVCDEECRSPCRDGDVALAVHGAAADVIIDVVGYFEPSWAAVEGEPAASTAPPQDNRSQQKTLTYWAEATTAGDIHYSEGHVGIGTDSPSRDLEIFGSWPALVLNSSNDTDPVVLFEDQGSLMFSIRTDDSNDNAFEIRRGGPDPPAFLTIKRQHGEVGIGTDRPSAKLDVRSSSNCVQIRVSDNKEGYYNSDNYTDISYFSSEDRRYFTIQQQADYEVNSFFIKAAAAPTDTVFQFDTNTNPGAVVVTEAGKVGIGSSNPVEALQVAGNLGLSGNIIPDGDICIGSCGSQ